MVLFCCDKIIKVCYNIFVFLLCDYFYIIFIFYSNIFFDFGIVFVFLKKRKLFFSLVSLIIKYKFKMVNILVIVKNVLRFRFVVIFI